MVFNVGGRILSRHWPGLLLLSLLLVGPGALLTAATGARFSELMVELLDDLGTGVGSEDGLPAGVDLERFLEPLATWFGGSIVAGILASLGTVGFSAVVAGDYHGRRIDAVAALGVVLRRAPAALGFMLVTSLIVAGLALGAAMLMTLVSTGLGPPGNAAGGPGAFIGLVLLVGLAVVVVVLSMRWAPAFPAIVEEDLGWRASLRRSWELSADNVLRILAVIALGSILTLLVSTFISPLLSLMLAAALSPLAGTDDTLSQAVALAAASTIVAPVVPVLTAVLFYDLRARREAQAGDTDPRA